MWHKVGWMSFWKNGREITMKTIQLSHIYIYDYVEYRENEELMGIAELSLITRDYKGMACDSALYDATITIISSVSLNLLSSWIYDKYKQNRIKKPMINGIEVDIENITPEEILAIFAKDKHVDASEDGTKE